MGYLMQIRKDIQADGYGVPVGTGYYSDSSGLESRWVNEGTDSERFQVLLNGEWLEAESIDWEDVDKN